MKKKLLVFTSTFPRWKNDTIPPFVYELSKRLTSDFDITVLTPNFPGAKKDEIMDKMKIHRFRYFPIEKFEKFASNEGILPTLKKNKFYYLMIPFFLMSEFFALRKQIKKDRPDVIHAHWIIPQGIITALIKKIYGVDYVVTSHGSDILGLKGFKSLKKFILKNAKKITVVSNAIKKEIKTNIDGSLKINVIPMGVDTELFNPNKKDTSLRIKYDITGPFLLFVGRLAPEKGVEYLIQAMPEVLEKYPKAKLLIIGDGPLKEKINHLIHKFSLKDKIFLIGKLKNKDLPPYYATSDLFISPSLREGSPVSYIEALTSGTKILVGDLPISREITKRYGGEVVSHDPIKISNKIKSNIKNKTKINYKKVQKKYNWDNIAKNLIEVLK
jgi:glycosyltransferase involved in cell wall biosynthesis